jgi:hypothetical protein
MTVMRRSTPRHAVVYVPVRPGETTNREKAAMASVASGGLFGFLLILTLAWSAWFAISLAFATPTLVVALFNWWHYRRTS